MKAVFIFGMLCIANLCVSAQMRQPSTTTRPYVIKTKQDLSSIEKLLSDKPGNTNEDVVAASGNQMRVAVFHDEKRENDNVEIHDGSDDIYYVLKGTATLQLGGTLDAPSEISPGEWRSKSASGGTRVVINKGDLIVVPRGTAHQRTVTGKGFSMILIKVFEKAQPVK